MDDEDNSIDYGSITINGSDGLSVGMSDIIDGDTITFSNMGGISASYNVPYEVATYDGTSTMTVKGDLVVEDADTGETTNISEFIRTVKDRLHILEPKPEHLEKYAALRDLYEQYKMMEKLLTTGNDDKTNLDMD